MSLLDRRAAMAVFSVFAFAYFLSALLRAVTATLAPVLTAEFSLRASDLGLLAGGYFVGFAATQLPLGAWLDRYGPKRVVIAFLAVAVAGCLAFAWADSFWALLAARALCGAGVSACLMAPLTGYRRWLTPAAQLRANSWMLMTGSFGMLASTLPVQWLLPHLGWRPLFGILAVLVALSAAGIAWWVPAWALQTAQDTQQTATSVPERGYAAVWRSPYFRRMAPIGFFSYGGMVAIQTLWAGPWMARVSGYTPLQAAQGLFWINLGMLCTFWCWGLATPALFRRGWDVNRLVTWGMPVSYVVLAMNIIAGDAAGAGAWALFCMTSTFMALAQPAVALAFAPQLAGRALSAFNLVVFSGVFAVQWGIGLLIDAAQVAGLAEVDAFRTAMAVFWMCSVAGYVWFVVAGRDNAAPRKSE